MVLFKPTKIALIFFAAMQVTLLTHVNIKIYSHAILSNQLSLILYLYLCVLLSASILTCLNEKQIFWWDWTGCHTAVSQGAWLCWNIPLIGWPWDREDRLEALGYPSPHFPVTQGSKVPSTGILLKARLFYYFLGNLSCAGKINCMRGRPSQRRQLLFTEKELPLSKGC